LLASVLANTDKAKAVAQAIDASSGAPSKPEVPQS
jgi:hypothetical protein